MAIQYMHLDSENMCYMISIYSRIKCISYYLPNALFSPLCVRESCSPRSSLIWGSQAWGYGPKKWRAAPRCWPSQSKVHNVFLWMVEWPISLALEVLHLSGGCKNEGIGPEIKKGQEKQAFLSTKYERLSIWMVEGLFKWQTYSMQESSIKYRRKKTWECFTDRFIYIFHSSRTAHNSQLTNPAFFLSYHPICLWTNWSMMLIVFLAHRQMISCPLSRQVAPKSFWAVPMSI